MCKHMIDFSFCVSNYSLIIITITEIRVYVHSKLVSNSTTSKN